MTHEYTILLGGTVIPGGGQPDASAIAWAHDTVLLVGTDADVRAISRGDSHFFDLGGNFVVSLGEPLDVGGQANLAVVEDDPRSAKSPPRRLAVVRAEVGVRVIPLPDSAGRLPRARRKVGVGC